MKALEMAIKELETEAVRYNNKVATNNDTSMQAYYLGRLDGLTYSLAALKSIEYRVERQKESLVVDMEKSWYKTKAERRGWLGDL